MQEQGDGEPTAAHKQATWPRLAAAIRHRLTQLLSALQVPTPVQSPAELLLSTAALSLQLSLAPVSNFSALRLCQMPSLMACLQHCLLVADPIVCCVQAWTSSAHGFLPSSASVYASTVSVFGSKSPLRRLDGGHWSLVSGLVVVSAVYFFREHGHTTRERRLRKELLNSQAEISKLVMKVIYNQAWVDALRLHPLQFASVSSSSAGTLCVHIQRLCLWLCRSSTCSTPCNHQGECPSSATPAACLL